MGARDFVEDWRASVGRALERGAVRGAVPTACSLVYGAIASRRLARPVPLPPGVRAFGIGGAVLGGSGKTPVAVALAAALARAGEAVALVGHAYRARLPRARKVLIDDPVGLVGDDALMAARALAGTGAAVVVAPSRAAACALAASEGARTLVFDGVLQLAPRRVEAAVLVVDPAAPWGAEHCPPCGDLRAPREALLAAADCVVALAEDGSSAPPAGAIALPTAVDGADSMLLGHLSWAEIARLDVGLVSGVAHPERLVRTLAAARVTARVVAQFSDHASFAAAARRRLAAERVDLWLTTARCATKLPPSLGGAPVLALRQRVDVGPLLSHLQNPQRHGGRMY